jgi:hypothetical protein
LISAGVPCIQLFSSKCPFRDNESRVLGIKPKS